MRSRITFSLIALCLAVTGVVQAQGVVFAYSSIEEGLEAAREQGKLAIVYFFDNTVPGGDAYASIWNDPLITRFVPNHAVTIAIDANSEDGAAFNERAKKRLKGESTYPGIYFFTKTGRSLGVLHGNLQGQEGVGRVMMMLGAAEHASSEPQGRERYRRRRGF